MKKTALKRKSRMKKVRKKKRPGRLKGEDLKQLRADCYYLDRGLCRECGKLTVFDGPKGHEDTFEMAHIRGKRMWGDSTDQVRTLCHVCHSREHNWGKSMVKPVPAKDRAA